MDEDILTVAALQNERDYTFEEPTEPAEVEEVPELPDLQPEPPPEPQRLNKRLAFKEGCRARHGGDAARDRDAFLRDICGLPQATKAELLESFDAGLRKGRDPDLPEKAAKVITQLEQDGPIQTQTKLGRSRHYPRLLMMAYIIGHDGKPFTFAKHRIAEALRVPSVSVQNFIPLAHKWLLLDTVAPGVPGLDGSPAWYRLLVDDVRKELGLNGDKVKRILDLLKVA